MRFDARCYDYVNRSYDDVRAAVLAAPAELFTRGTRVGAREAGAIAQLHARVGPLDVAADVAIKVSAVYEDTRYDRPATVVKLAWSHPQHPGLFPSMIATIAVYPLSPTETQLELDGTYEPPLGLVGAALDSVLGHRLARAAIDGFVHEVAASLRQPA
jgi:hypothetical protein